MTETNLVKVVCPDCRQPFDVPDGAEEAQCPNCAATSVWRSCLDTGEVFTVLRRWETWIHPNCATRHPVDLTAVVPIPVDSPDAEPRHATSEQPAPSPVDQAAYAPVMLAEDVDWSDQSISGQLIVDTDRLAILPPPDSTRAPLSVAWLADVSDYAVHRAEVEGGEAGKRKRFGRKKDGHRASVLVLYVPGGQIVISVGSEPEVLQAHLDQFLRPRMSPPAGGYPPPVPVNAPSALVDPAPVQSRSLPTPSASDDTTVLPVVPSEPPAPTGLPDLEPDTPEAVYESIRKLAELAVLGTISSEDFAAKKAQLLARL